MRGINSYFYLNPEDKASYDIVWLSLAYSGHCIFLAILFLLDFYTSPNDAEYRYHMWPNTIIESCKVRRDRRKCLPVTMGRSTKQGMDLNDRLRIRLVFVVVVHNIDRHRDVWFQYRRNTLAVIDGQYRKLYYTENGKKRMYRRKLKRGKLFTSLNCLTSHM